MSEIKKALGRKSRRIGSENRAKVFLTIAKKPLTFSELLNETKLSRASLTQHLENLQKDDLIEKAIIEDKIVYQVKFATEKVLVETISKELEKDFFLPLLQILSWLSPKINEQVKELLRDLAKDIVKYGKERAFKKRFRKPSEPQEQPTPIVELEEVRE